MRLGRHNRYTCGRGGWNWWQYESGATATHARTPLSLGERSSITSRSVSAARSAAQPLRSDGGLVRWTPLTDQVWRRSVGCFLRDGTRRLRIPPRVSCIRRTSPLNPG